MTEGHPGRSEGSILRKKNMWLPKDERETLAFYYQKTAAGSTAYSYKEPTELISYLSNKTKLTKAPPITSQAADQMTCFLMNSGLIKIDIIPLSAARMVRLTPEGIRLGQKYNSWWSRSNLWYEEHLKNHWIWLIISFIGGIIIGLLVNWLSSFFGAK
jgi:hypothetical protein